MNVNLGRGFIITGSSSGIGAQIALEAFRRGHPVIGCAFDSPERAVQITPALADAMRSNNFQYHQVDVTNQDALRRFADQSAQFMASFSERPDQIAAIPCAGLAFRKNPDRIEAMRKVNVGGTINFIEALRALAFLRPIDWVGAVSSIVAARNCPLPGDENYMLTKAEVRAYVEGMKDCRTFTIAPGAVDTPMTGVEPVMAWLGILLCRDVIFNPATQFRQGLEQFLDQGLASTPMGILGQILVKGGATAGKAEAHLAKLDTPEELITERKRFFLAGSLLKAQSLNEDTGERTTINPLAHNAITAALRYLDIAIAPQLIATRVVDLIQSGVVPVGGLLEVYSESPTMPILGFMKTLSDVLR